MDGEYAVRSWTLVVELVLRDSPVCISFKQEVQSIFFIVTDVHWQAFHSYVPIWIFLNRDIAWLFMSWHRREQIKHQLIVDFHIRNSNRDCLLKLRPNLLEHLWNASWNETSVLVILGRSTHCEGLACPCLSIAQNSPIVALDCVGHNVLGTECKNLLLTHVMKNLVELELPTLKLIIDNSSFWILWNCHLHFIWVQVNGHILGSKIRGRSGSNDDLDCLG